MGRTTIKTAGILEDNDPTQLSKWNDIVQQGDKLIRCLLETNQSQATQEITVLCSMVQSAGLRSEAFSPLLHWANALYAKTLQLSQIPIACFWNTYLQLCSQFQSCKTAGAFKRLHFQMFNAYYELYGTYALKAYNSITRSIICFIRLNLGSRLDLQTIAEHMGFSPTYVSHQFKKDVGVPPMQYITAERMRTAAYLLQTTDIPIQEIAVSVGFTDMSYFSKQFRKTTGLTPSQFRSSL